METLLSGGADVITGGNHSWDGPDVHRVLTHPLVARPDNVDDDIGQGVITIGSGDTALTVVNLLSPSAVTPGMKAPQPADVLPAWATLADSDRLHGTVLIDFHGESAIEKAAFASAIDGQVAAVLGTHTHDPSLRTHVLDAGTAYVTEVGMTGRLGQTGMGFETSQLAASIRGEDPSTMSPYRLSTGPYALGAVHLSVSGPAPGTTTRISRVD